MRLWSKGLNNQAASPEQSELAYMQVQKSLSPFTKQHTLQVLTSLQKGAYENVEG